MWICSILRFCISIAKAASGFISLGCGVNNGGSGWPYDTSTCTPGLMLCLKDEAFAFAPCTQGLIPKGFPDERKRIDGLVRTLGRFSCSCIFHVLGKCRGLMGSLLSWISLELIEQEQESRPGLHGTLGS